MAFSSKRTKKSIQAIFSPKYAMKIEKYYFFRYNDRSERENINKYYFKEHSQWIEQK